MKPLILGLGNELLGDDGVGIFAARRLASEIGEQADVIECNLSGVALLDVLVGYQQAIIIDAIFTDRLIPGTIIHLNPAELQKISNPSPHYTGLPEMISMADRLDLVFPREIKILAVAVADPFTIGETMHPPVAEAVNELVDLVKKQLRRWKSRSKPRAPVI